MFSWTIRGKLSAITVLLLIPLIGLSVIASKKALAELEAIDVSLEGLAHLKGLWTNLATTASGRDKSFPLDSREFVALKGFMADHKTGAASNLVQLKENAPLNMESVLDLIRVVSDVANLHTNPDVSGSYLADIVTQQLPNLLHRLAVMKSDGDVIALAQNPPLDRSMAFLVDAGSFKLLADGIDYLNDNRLATDLGSSASQMLKPPLDALSAANTAYQDAAAKLFESLASNRRLSASEQERFSSAYQTFTDKIDQVWKASSNAYQTHLAQRRADLVSSVTFSIGASLAIALLAVILVVSLARSIVFRIVGLERQILSIADRAETDMLTDQSRDEIGRLARAVVYLNEKTSKRLRFSLESDAERANVERAEEMAKVVQEVGLVVGAAAQGDFSRRVTARTAQHELGELIDSVNRINEVVDESTAEFAAVLGAVTRGELTQMVERTYAGRFGELKESINSTIARLADTVATIQATTSEVRHTAHEINEGADNLSRRTDMQASSLGATAATSEELAVSVKATAEASRQAVSVAGEASGVARTGGEIVQKAVEAMGRIETASKKISDITDIIEEIAFQTNLLALNASVEAARAGETGKGFAVVAAEVRQLAQRSSLAAKDISALIHASAKQVDEGVRLVRSAGDVLGQIVQASEKVTENISEISSASHEQAKGINQMTEALARMEEITHQNAELSKQSVSSGSSLAAQVESLENLLAIFSTGSDAAAEEHDHRSISKSALETSSVKRSAGGSSPMERRRALG